MTNYNSLEEFKVAQKISDSNGSNISFIFQELFYEYFNENNGMNDSKEKNRLLGHLLSECKEVNPTLIPYEDITNIIFADYDSKYTEFPFTERLKNDYENLITRKFSESDAEEETKIRTIIKNLYNPESSAPKPKLKINEEDKNSILVVYKIIQHTQLAITQKQNLYESLERQVDNLEEHVNIAANKYDNMTSNFISILGIFAAIMMATFGAIQGFSAIYTNESQYNMTQILLISSFGLFALISVIYLLLYSISKLVDKEFGQDIYYQKNIFIKHPIYSHTVLISLMISLLTLTHLLKIDPPDYLPEHLMNNAWQYTILVIIFISVLYYLNNLVLQSDGYWHINKQINNYIMKVKNKLELFKMVNYILWFVIFLIILIVLVLLFSIIFI